MSDDRDLPISQQEARRRVDAARAFRFGSAGMKTLEARTGMSEGLLKALGRSRKMQLKHAKLIAKECGVPDEWFTVPDLAEAVRLGSLALTSQPEGAAPAGPALGAPPPAPLRPEEDAQHGQSDA